MPQYAYKRCFLTVINTVEPVLGDLCHEGPPVLNDRFPRHRSFLIIMQLVNATSDHTHCSRDRCFHLLTAAGLCVVVGFEFTKYTYRRFDLIVLYMYDKVKYEEIVMPCIVIKSVT